MDVKRPEEGSLGGNFPWVLREILEAVPPDIETSAAIGDMGPKPGLASLAADNVSSMGFDYVKVGLRSVAGEEGFELASAFTRAVDGGHAVIAGYGDYERVGAPSPLEVLEIASEAGADVAMLDTAVKDGATLFDLLPEERVERFAARAEEAGLRTALAGSLDLDGVVRASESGADIVGVRGAACGGDRGDAIDEDCVRALAEVLG